MDNFDRQYRLMIGTKGKNNAFEIGDGEYPLRISFSLDKADTTTQNEAKITVWNLSKEHRDMLENKDCTVVLSAGYGNNLALAFCGNVTEASSSIDGADMQTEISVVDGLVEIRDTYISLSYAGVINTKKVIDDIANKMGVSLVFAPKITFKDLLNGYTFVGQAKAALNKVCKSSNLTWTLQNGVLQVKSHNQAISNRVYVLSAETGLLDTPKRIVKSDEEKTDSTSEENSKNNSSTKTTKKTTKKKSQKGWEVRYFMNLAIGVNDFVRLESKIATGYYRVDSIKISGDNISGDWTCTAELMEVSVQ